eukprot:77945-Alexandrium_andersonii.AAC.1
MGRLPGLRGQQLPVAEAPSIKARGGRGRGLRRPVQVASSQNGQWEKRRRGGVGDPGTNAQQRQQQAWIVRP